MTSRETVLGTNAIAYLFLLLTVFALGLPFFWMFVTSLKPPTEINVYPPAWLPTEIRWSNYTEAWNAAPFGRFYLNSILVSGLATIAQIAFAMLMAYAFVFTQFPAKTALLLLVLSTMMIPDEMKLVPNFILLSRLGWIDTYAGLIVPTIAHAFPVFVLYQQFRQLPHSLIEAAQADGAGHLRILWQIAAPMSRPVLTAVALVSLLGQWNAYLWPLIVTNSGSMRTLPLGIAYLRKQAEEGSVQWNLLMAAAVFVVLPIVILYTFAQKQFVEGITRGALKG
ncbi:MAG: carbohydrate ABC transporter permease [Candidatus Hydrogenedentes bacterium]|nr:carbohydrate ABC transporter permease [Candidatus Hydrogenedentota bacterium]